MSLDGNLKIQLHLSELDNFYGNKVIQHMPPKKKLKNKHSFILISTEEFMRNF